MVSGLYSNGAVDDGGKEKWAKNEMSALKITGASTLAASAAALGALIVAF